MKIWWKGTSFWLEGNKLLVCIGFYKYDLFFFELSKEFFGITFLGLDLRINWMDKEEGDRLAEWAINQTLYHLPEILDEVRRTDE